MKTVQDWGFISKEQGLVKPKLQDNKIFHALTTAYENNHQQEIYGATENIVRREKELCELALADLKKLSGGKGDPDGTVKLVMEHYQNRLEMSREKEEKINRISEDSRKMMEEYKKRTHELAEVKRNLMESQTKLRELAKNTEKLLKQEEELRFIENNLRQEMDKNKRNIINGLYEIVIDITDQPATASQILEQTIFVEPETPATTEKTILGGINAPRLFTEGLFRNEEPVAPVAPKPEQQPVKREVTEILQPPKSTETVWSRDNATTGPLAFSGPISPPSQIQGLSSKPSPSLQNPSDGREGSLVEKAARLKIYEPGKSLVSKSMVKTPDGEVISEYFYSPLHPREGRNYVFNSLHAFWSLLGLKAKSSEAFHERLETVFTDLLSRLEHSHNIHLESFLAGEINRQTLGNLLTAPKETRLSLFEGLASKVLGRIESIGAGRSGLIEIQFKQMPKPEFPPKPGLTA